MPVASTLLSTMSDDDLCWIPAQTYTMGSDAHYAEEAPAHPVSVDAFWIAPPAR